MITIELADRYFISCLHEDGSRTFRCIDHPSGGYPYYESYPVNGAFNTYDDAHACLKKIWEDYNQSMSDGNGPSTEVSVAAGISNDNPTAKICLEIVRLQVEVCSSQPFSVALKEAERYCSAGYALVEGVCTKHQDKCKTVDRPLVSVHHRYEDCTFRMPLDTVDKDSEFDPRVITCPRCRNDLSLPELKEKE